MWCVAQVIEQNPRPKHDRASCTMRKARIYWKLFITVRCFLCLASEAEWGEYSLKQQGREENTADILRFGQALKAPGMRE